MTQFGCALSELNIEILCANTSQAKGRVERAHHTLQDRLVKELRLTGISTIEAANAFLPAFVQTHNARFAKPPARDRDLHRPMAGMNDLDDILCWREKRSVSRQLMVNRMKFMLRPDKISAAVAGKLVDIYDFPDGRLEIRWKGLPSLLCLRPVAARQPTRPSSRISVSARCWPGSSSSRISSPTIGGDLVGPRRSNQKAGLMKDRVDRLAQGPKSQPRPARLGRRRCDSDVFAAPAQAPSEAAE
jgi:hypothetical protein